MIEPGLLAWHFSEDDRLSHDDRRRMVDDETLHIDGQIIACQNGLHGSERPIDALTYAQGSRVSRVQLFGMLVAHGYPIDKYAASDRTQLWHADATEVLRTFAFSCAAHALRRAAIPNIAQELTLMEAYAAGQHTISMTEVIAAAITAATAADTTYATHDHYTLERVACANAETAAEAAARTASTQSFAVASAAARAARSARLACVDEYGFSEELELQNSELERRLLALQPV